MLKRNRVVATLALGAFMLLSPSAFGVERDTRDPFASPRERLIQLVKRIVKPLGEIIIPRPEPPPPPPAG